MSEKPRSVEQNHLWYIDFYIGLWLWYFLGCFDCIAGAHLQTTCSAIVGEWQACIWMHLLRKRWGLQGKASRESLYQGIPGAPPAAWISSCMSVLVGAIKVMCSGKAHSSIFVFLVAVALAGGAAWFWFDVFVVCGSLAEVVFDAWAAS